MHAPNPPSRARRAAGPAAPAPPEADGRWPARVAAPAILGASLALWAAIVWPALRLLGGAGVSP